MTFEPNQSQDEWCDYSSGLLVPKTQWRRMDYHGNRFYYTKINDEIVVGCGITTAIDRSFGESVHLREWKDTTPNWKPLLKEMASYGTLCHIGFASLLKDGVLPQTYVDIASEVFNKKTQFQKDMLSLRQFILDYKVKPIFIEGILGKEYEFNGTKSYICTAMDLFCSMEITEKTKTQVEDGVYVRGDKKGEIKYKDEIKETVLEVFAAIDLKSNFNSKEQKAFFESHAYQLIFGRECICAEFGYKKEDIRIFNISPLGWVKEPKYVLTEHKEKVNKYGFTNEQLLYNRLNTAVMEGVTQPSGLVTEIGEIKMDNNPLIIKNYYELAESKLNNQ